MDITPELIAKYTLPGMTAEGARRVCRGMVQEYNLLQQALSRARDNRKFWADKITALDAEIAVLEEALTV